MLGIKNTRLVQVRFNNVRLKYCLYFGEVGYSNVAYIGANLGVDCKEFRETLEQQFNATCEGTIILFNSKSDAYKAREWVISIIMANKLKEG